MNEWLKQVKEEWNRTSDSEWYRSLRTDKKISALGNDPSLAFHPEVYKLLIRYLPDMKHKKILLPSSGDNHAAFAFAMLGADVTSADISERQMENAAEIASKLELHIRFVCDDTMQLSKIESDCYDLVYTSNGTHTWITDLNAMYTNISRVLKKTGVSVMYDIHPFNRPFAGDAWKEPKIMKSYFDSKEYRHWRVEDLVNAMSFANLAVKEMLELRAIDASFWFSYGELIRQQPDDLKNINNWKCNPMAALPAWISIVAQK